MLATAFACKFARSSSRAGQQSGQAVEDLVAVQPVQAEKAKEAEAEEAKEAEARLLVEQAMSDAASFRKAVKVKDVTELVADQRYAAYKAHEKEVRKAAREFAKLLKGKWGQRFSSSIAHLLVSGPEFDLADRPILAVLHEIIDELGGDNFAGDAKDTFHQEVMLPEDLSKEKMNWRPAWKGKVCTGVKTYHKRMHISKSLLVTLKGGPETDWEQDEISQRLLPAFRKAGMNTEVLHFDSIEQFFGYVAQS